MTLRFRSVGPGVDGPVVLMSAGLGGLGRFWTPQLDAVSRTFQVVSYDHRGTGDNREPLPDPYTIELMAQDVLEVLDHAIPGRAVHFVGHALGGLIGLALALGSPERVASLTLVNAWATLAPHTGRCFDARMALLDHGGPSAYLRAQSIFLYPAEWIAENEVPLAHEVEEGLAQFQGAPTLDRRVGAIRSFDAGARLDALTTPTLIVGATDDVLVPVSRSRDLGRIPGSRLWHTTGGHSCTVTNPIEFNTRLLDFLREVDATSGCDGGRSLS